MPTKARSGLDSSMQLSITREGGFDGPVDVAITAEWLSMFVLGGLDPDPDSETADPERVIWSFDPPPGDTLEVSVDLTLRPAVRTGEDARLAVVDSDGNELTGLDFRTGVVP